MQSESGINPHLQASNGATGLIMFMPATARGLGTSVDELKQMSRAQQMKYVEKLFDQVRLPHGASGGQIYAHIFLPGRAKKSNILTTSGEGYYKWNKGLDLDKDGDIDITDLDARVANKRASIGLAESKKIKIKFGEVLSEAKKKEDRCVRIAKSKYDAWPSAYASGAVVKCRQGKIWKNIKEEEELEEDKKSRTKEKLKKHIVSAISGLMAVNPPPGSTKPIKNKPAVVKKDKKDLDEEWSEKYKRSIDCKNPKGFSQRAHCQGRKKKNKD
jgi:hypothetical protein